MHAAAMLAIANGLVMIWGFVVDPLLTSRFTRQAKNSRRMSAYNRGILSAAGTIRAIAARPEIFEFESEPDKLLLAVAKGIEQAVAELDA